MSKAKTPRFIGSSGSLFASYCARAAGSVGGVAQAPSESASARSATNFMRILVWSKMAAGCFQFFVALAGHGFEWIWFTTFAANATAKLTIHLRALAYFQDS